MNLLTYIIKFLLIPFSSMSAHIQVPHDSHLSVMSNSVLMVLIMPL